MAEPCWIKISIATILCLAQNLASTSQGMEELEIHPVFSSNSVYSSNGLDYPGETLERRSMITPLSCIGAHDLQDIIRLIRWLVMCAQPRKSTQLTLGRRRQA
ncbi:hypothetical protein EV421DRAFT_1828428 [Armillaria borealis]|uniref:Uncharacterized protein n=1 Tax=Armillaria borealis TaxID=47425 RepID=A0AA39J707_9AGAR|nr:hypothetical protein EV421DRAFT_1828428 [Armillaria borealis]